jgi:TRAP-type uncharacterized transport system fused permease subunit
VLGLGLPTIACYIVLATLVAPTLIQMGIDPMAAHMFILYYGCLSMISPPVAIAAFVAANLAGADHNRTGWLAMAFGWTLFVVPFLFVYSTTLLLKGPPHLIVIDFAVAVAGVWLVAAAMMGYARHPLSVPERLSYAAAGILLLLPHDTLGLWRWPTIAGAVLGVLLLVWERFIRRGAGAAARVEPERADAPAKPATPAGDHTDMLERMGVRGTIEGA